MCRFVMYLGPAATLSSLVTEPRHSIIHQSYKAREREEPLNGDGFGVAWYSPAYSDRAVIFKDVSPAWNNRNLLNLAPVIESRCLLAHVRAATPGMPVSQSDCHPFGWDRLAFMHNGAVAAFHEVRRALRSGLSRTAYDSITGGTDTEHLFALFIDKYRDHAGLAGTERLFASMADTIAIIEEMTETYRGSEPSDLNLAVTDGERAVVSRYSSDGRPPNTLYVRENRRVVCDDEGTEALERTDSPAVLIASEPLTDDEGWTCVDRNCALIVDASKNVEQRSLG